MVHMVYLLNLVCNIHCMRVINTEPADSGASGHRDAEVHANSPSFGISALLIDGWQRF